MKKKENAPMNISESIEFLKKMGEHHTILITDTDTLVKWANFLKNRESLKSDPRCKSTKDKLK